MKKIMIIGCCGAGKSTLSRKIHDITKLELIHLDKEYWQPNWTETNKAEWRKKVGDLTDKTEWIIDGNYGGTMDIRIEKADTIIYLDYPTWKCLWRVLFRTFKHFGQSRPDMNSECKERFSLEFLHYVATFRQKQGKKIAAKLKAKAGEKAIFIFRHDSEAELFLENLKKANT